MTDPIEDDAGPDGFVTADETAADETTDTDTDTDTDTETGSVDTDTEPVSTDTEVETTSVETAAETSTPEPPAADTDESDAVAASPATDDAPPTDAPVQPDAPASTDEPADDAADAEVGFRFSDLGLRPELLSALATLGYEEPTPIQRETIPVVLAGHDLVGQAATGTGKTAAFALPVLQRIPGRNEQRANDPVALVLVPTRELAIQVSEAMYKYGKDLGARVVPIYGGQPIGRQLDQLRRGVDIVVATPGRAIDHIQRGSLSLKSVRVVVLDEADEMLDMGFADEIEAILSDTPGDRQTLLFSATMPPRIDSIARRHLRNPQRIQIRRVASEAGTVPLVRQRAFIVSRAHKAAALGRILDVESPTAAIVFCRTRTEVDQLTETLNGRGYRAEALHGGMSQEQRDRVMSRMRSGTAELLIATDVAARGLDLDQLTHVVNYDVPSAPEAYVHRIGRVGRAGREGIALTLAEPREQRQLANIERLTKQTITIEPIPSVADLRARQFEQTMATLRTALAADDLEAFAPLVDGITPDTDLRTLALAAVKLIHEVSATTDNQEIPDARPRHDRDPGARRNDRDGGRPDRGERKQHDGEPARIYVSLGRTAGVRPQDLVGLIANETGLTGKEIGPIRITEKFSIVGVPEASVEHVLETLRRTTIKGKQATMRRYSEEYHTPTSRHRPGGDRPGYDRPGGDRPGGDRPSRDGAKREPRRW